MAYPQCSRLLIRLALVLLCATAFFSLTLPILAANPGDLDPTFGNGGVVTTTISSNSIAYAIAIQGDDKIVVVGGSNREDGFNNGNFALARYTITGSLDSTFDNDGIVTTSIGSNGFARAVAVQSDNRIIVGGSSSAGFLTGSSFTLARYTITGSLDSNFGSSGVVTTSINSNGVVNAIALQADNKIVAVGYISLDAGFSKIALARYTITGSLDSTFGNKGVLTTSIGNHSRGNDTIVQPDGKIIVAGDSDGSGQWAITLIRYTITGSLDSTFGNSGIVTTPVGNDSFGRAVAILPNNKILVAGDSSVGIVVARYTITGSLDSTFGNSGIATAPFPAYNSGMIIQPDGKIIVAGGSQNAFALARFQPIGNLDSGFGNSGIITTAIGIDAGGSDVASHLNGKIVIAGASSNTGSYMFTLARYLGNTPNLPPHTYLPLILKP